PPPHALGAHRKPEHNLPVEELTERDRETFRVAGLLGKPSCRTEMVDGSGEVAGEPGADLETVVRQYRESGIALRLGERLAADTGSFRKIADRIREPDEQVGALSARRTRPEQLSQQLPG